MNHQIIASALSVWGYGLFFAIVGAFTIYELIQSARLGTTTYRRHLYTRKDNPVRFPLIMVIRLAFSALCIYIVFIILSEA